MNPDMKIKNIEIWREIRLSKDEDKKWHQQPVLERSWMTISAVLPKPCLNIKSLEGDIGFVMLVQDIIKLKVLL